MNKKNILLSIGLSLLVLGCNGSSNSNSDDTNEENPSSVQQKISVPKKVGMTIPQALKKTSQTTTSQKLSDEEDAPPELEGSRGYMQLKEQVAELENIRQDMEMNLLLIGELMSDIESRCAGTAISTTCTIPAGELFLTFSDTLIDEVVALDSEAEGMRGETIPLGKIEFTQYADSQTFQYGFKMIDEGEEGDYIQTVKWSKDENHILSAYESNEADFAFNMSIDYTQKANGEKVMTMDDTFRNGDGWDTFQLNIVDKGAEHYLVTSSNSMGTENFSSTGELSNQGGFLIFSGKFGNDEFREKELFDGEGNLISGSFCDSSSTECILSDPTTWLVYGEDSFEIEEGLDFDIDEGFDDLDEYEYIPLDVTGGNLNGEYYLLLAPEKLPEGVAIESLSMEVIYEAQVGCLYNYDGEVSGTLLFSSYKEQLGSLVLIQEIFNENLEAPAPSFRSVASGDSPTLSIAVFNEVEIGDEEWSDESWSDEEWSEEDFNVTIPVDINLSAL
jgi:hypothetical protein